MGFIDDIKNRAKKDIKTIVLPEATDIRVLKATEKIGKEGFAKVILIGDEEKVHIHNLVRSLRKMLIQALFLELFLIFVKLVLMYLQ